jgi:hypothetical protein
MASDLAVPMKPHMNDAGNGHGCDEWYVSVSMSTSTPLSSCTSRTTASSSDSAASTNPAKHEYNPIRRQHSHQQLHQRPLASGTRHAYQVESSCCGQAGSDHQLGSGSMQSPPDLGFVESAREPNSSSPMFECKLVWFCV